MERTFGYLNETRTTKTNTSCTFLNGIGRRHSRCYESLKGIWGFLKNVSKSKLL